MLRSSHAELWSTRRAAVAAVAAAVVLAGCGGGGGDEPPADDAARLVPASALVYVHLSTDTGRSGTKAARDRARTFPGYARLRASLIRRLSAPNCPLPAKALDGGREAALALVDTGGGQAGSLVLLDTGNAEKEDERTCGTLQTLKVGRFLVIGQPQSVALARRLADGKGGARLADAKDYRRTLSQLPAGRVADAWVSQAGVRRLLEPQGGLLGVAGTLLDQPGLTATAAALTAADGGARVQLRTLRRGTTGGAPFTPTLQKNVPAGTMGVLLLKGLAGAVPPLLGLTAAGGSSLSPLLARAGRDLAPLARLFSGEVAVTVGRADPAPVLTVITRKVPAARTTLAAARPKIARLLATDPAKPPRWTLSEGVWSLQALPGLELHYAVQDDLVVVSTRRSGLDAVRVHRGDVTGDEAWRRAVGKVQKPIRSLVFLDFNQLLRLGEQTGLDDNRAYREAKDDLRKLRSVGARSSSEGDESTVELFLSFS